MIILPHNKTIFIHIPRTGGTSMRKALIQTFPEAYEYDRKPFTKHWSIKDVYKEFPKYSYFCFMRDPFDRVISFYHLMKKHYPFNKSLLDFKTFVKELASENPEFKDCYTYKTQHSYFEGFEEITNLFFYNPEGNWISLEKGDFPQKQLIKNLKDLKRLNMSKRSHTNWNEYYTEKWMKDTVFQLYQDDFYYLYEPV